MAEEEDPFGAFGDDDSNSEQSEDESAKRITESLLQKANAAEKKSPSELLPTSNAEAPMLPKSPSVDLSSLQSCQIPWDPPLYISPNAKLVSNLPYGGERGYVATSDLPAGTLVMVDKPIMEWPEEQLGKELSLLTVKYLLDHRNAAKILADLEDFYPTKTVVDAAEQSENPEQIETMMDKLREKYGNKQNSLLSKLVEHAANRNVQNRNGTSLTSTDILRLFLSLRYNGLESGVYKHVAMLNHKCQPNCVKFMPPSVGTGMFEMEFSEVRTTRRVAAGESLTISYMSKLVCHASRHRHLWEQHRFDIGSDLEANLRHMEVINGGLPSSSKEFVDEDFVTSRIERSIAELDLMYQSAKDALPSSQTDKLNAEYWEQAKAIEVSSLELYVEAKSQLRNKNHLLLIPCLVLHLDACDLVLRHDARSSLSSSLTNAQRCKLLARQVTTAHNLIQLQRAYWGDDHFDLARTYLDLAYAIDELLSKSQKHLLELSIAKSNNLTNFRNWSSLQHQCRKEHERIRNLYPKDAAQHIVT